MASNGIFNYMIIEKFNVIFNENDSNDQKSKIKNDLNNILLKYCINSKYGATVFCRLIGKENIIKLCTYFNIPYKLNKLNTIGKWFLAYLRNEIHQCKTCGSQCLGVYCSNHCQNNDPDQERKNKIQNKITNTCLKKYGSLRPAGNKDIQTKIQETFKRNGSKEKADIKRRKTCLEKFGAEYYMQTDNYKKSVIEHNREKYGVDWYFQSDDFREKSKKKLLELYEVDNPAKNEKIFNKIKQTNLMRYGVEYIFQTEKCKENLKKGNYKKYGVDNPFKAVSVREKAIKTNLERYGVKSIFQSELYREYLKYVFVEKYGVECPLKSDVILNKIKDTMIKKYGVSYYIASNDFIHRHRSHMSKAENEFFEWIPCENKIHTERNLISPYELDIVLPSYKIAIEYNGLFWHSSRFKDENYHINKTNMCREQGFKLFNIWENENLDVWKSIILREINKISKTTIDEIHEISFNVAKDFFEKNSLENLKEGVSYGGFKDGVLIQVVNICENAMKISTLNYCGCDDKLINFVITKYKNIVYNMDMRCPVMYTFFENCNYIYETQPRLLKNNIYDCGEKIYVI